MKKVLLTFAMVVGFSFTSNAQCPENSTYIWADCLEQAGCYSIIEFTTFLSPPIVRKPSDGEARSILQEANRRCGSVSERNTTIRRI